LAAWADFAARSLVGRKKWLAVSPIEWRWKEMALIKVLKLLACTAVMGAVIMLAACAESAASADLTPQELLGRLIYFDENLSTPQGQACASCHLPTAGFADPDHNLPVSQGVLPENRFGNRNAPSSAYAAFSPDFHYDEAEELYVGGQFWDGRALNLAEQAKGPFLNPLEMNNPSKLKVIVQIRNSDYADLFEKVYGKGALKDIETAYDQVAEAIAAFEASSELNQFTSKYDYYLKGEVTLTEQELRGLALYEDPDAGNCAACHISRSAAGEPPPLFTDFTYDNLGVPKNPANPFYYLPPAFNKAGEDFVDYGLGAILGLPDEMGKVKVPTLRNIGATSPYMHNGVFSTLTEVVDFYNTRDVEDWPPPEVAENVNHDELGDLGLTPQEVDDIVAFLMTLTDGYDADLAMYPSPISARLGYDLGSESARSEAGSLASSSAPASLMQNSPNPFGDHTSIFYSLAGPGHVRVWVYDVNGSMVRTLVEDNEPSGVHRIDWDGLNQQGRAVVSGIYFYAIEAGGTVSARKAMLVR
jgi:cytochrome c peroxidase